MKFGAGPSLKSPFSGVPPIRRAVWGFGRQPVLEASEGAVAIVVEITDPETARPIDVRIDVVDVGAAYPEARARMIGSITRDGREYDVVGTYLGVVADEN